jgi:hypothetical protein
MGRFFCVIPLAMLTMLFLSEQDGSFAQSGRAPSAGGLASEQSNRKPGAHTLSWDSPRMVVLEKEWKSLDTRHGAHKPGEEAMAEIDRINNAQVSLLRKSLSVEDLRQLAASSSTLKAKTSDRRAFVDSVVGHIVVEFLASGDHDNLVMLFANAFPRYVGWYDIEFVLAAGNKKLKEPIRILGEAYEKCRVPQIRVEIAAAVRRAFTNSGVLAKEDADFVRNAMQWYDHNKGHLAVNPYYCLKATSIDPAHAKHALFIERPRSEGNGGKTVPKGGSSLRGRE